MWILIIALLAGNVPAVTTAEFGSKQACEHAADKFDHSHDDSDSFMYYGKDNWKVVHRAFCVPKD